MYYKGYEITIRRGFYVAIDLQGIANQPVARGASYGKSKQ